MADDISEAIQQMVEAGMQILEVMRPVLETLQGYKRELASLGYNEEQQNQMAADLHHMITHGIAGQAGRDG